MNNNHERLVRKNEGLQLVAERYRALSNALYHLHESRRSMGIPDKYQEPAVDQPREEYPSDNVTSMEAYQRLTPEQVSEQNNPEINPANITDINLIRRQAEAAARPGLEGRGNVQKAA